MTTPPSGPPGPPPDGSPDDGDRRDPRGNLPRIRNAIIALICLLALGALLATCMRDGALRTGNARSYIETTYTRDVSLDETGVLAYVANGKPGAVANEIAKAQSPTDLRSGAQQPGNIAGSMFLQYPDYLVGVFPQGANQSRVMVSNDYRTGYNHYHGYVGGYWVPTPRYSGPGNGYRGGGSGSGK